MKRTLDRDIQLIDDWFSRVENANTVAKIRHLKNKKKLYAAISLAITGMRESGDLGLMESQTINKPDVIAAYVQGHDF